MCLLAYLLWQLRDRVRPGVVFALYLVGSGLERFLVEFIRRNNEVFAGLTAPQLESLALLAIGLVWLALMVHRRGFAGLRHRERACVRRRATERRARSTEPASSQPASDNQRRWPPRRASRRVSRSAAALNERGRLEVGGCDTIELAREFGTPAYVVAEDDLRARAGRSCRPAARPGTATSTSCSPPRRSPAPPCSSCSPQEGLWCDVASGGELHLALDAGFAPERIVLHGNAKSEAELRDGAATRASG